MKSWNIACSKRVHLFKANFILNASKQACWRQTGMEASELTTSSYRTADPNKDKGSSWSSFTFRLTLDTSRLVCCGKLAGVQDFPFNEKGSHRRIFYNKTIAHKVHHQSTSKRTTFLWTETLETGLQLWETCWKVRRQRLLKRNLKLQKQHFLWFHQRLLKLFEISHSSLVCQEKEKKKRFSKVVDKETVCLLFTRSDSGEIKKTWFKIGADVFLLFSPFEAKIAETRQQKGCNECTETGSTSRGETCTRRMFAAS